MKKITISIILASMLLMTSCKDFLVKEPYGKFTADMIDDSAVEGFLAAAYAGLGAHYFGNNEAFAGPSTNWIFDVRSDDALKGGGGVTMEANIHLLEISNLTANNVSNLNKWQNNFYAIARCHKAMLGIAESSYPGKDAAIGELKVLRAYYYFDLIRIFERIPYFNEKDDPNTVRIDKYTRDEIFGFIKKDLEEAYDVMPERAASPGRFSKYVAAALHAKVSAQTSSWDEVIQWAEIVIGSNQYQLYNNYLDMSKIEYNNTYESILALQCTSANDNMGINWSNLLHATYSDGNYYGTGDDFFYASQDLADAFRTDANGLPYFDAAPAEHVGDYNGNIDPRIDFTMGRIGFPFRGKMYNEKWCRAQAVYGEYSNKKSMIDPDSPDMVQGWPWGASPLNFCFIRYADILLLEAEALIESNTRLDEARNYINMVREKASRSVNVAYKPLDVDPEKANYKVGLYDGVNFPWTQENARKAVRMERRLELAMEGHRWFDLCRWGNVVEVMNAYFQSEAKIRDYYSDASMSADEIFLPTPYDEVNNSHGLYKID